MYTNYQSNDGFGAQFQHIIQTYIFCKLNNKRFLYRPLEKVEHNYSGDAGFNGKLENLMNLKNNIENDIHNLASPLHHICRWFEDNIEICCDCEHMAFIKQCFWKNKDRDYFKNGKINIAVHIRRENPDDRGAAGQRITTPDRYYLEIMNKIRNEHKDQNIVFHIYSQSYNSNFIGYKAPDVELHIDENIVDTFIGLVAADILVTSPSSFSYVAALISDGKIYYKSFWHKPRQNWIIG